MFLCDQVASLMARKLFFFFLVLQFNRGLSKVISQVPCLRAHKRFLDKTILFDCHAEIDRNSP